MALTYQLDDLGWFEFERLIQGLVKYRLGAGVEAWGGSGDCGRDAYFEGKLKYPSNELSDGPFVFQCKFVDAANAAGADADDLVKQAVQKEGARINSRLKRDIWKKAPNHYALLTNAPLSPQMRHDIAELLKRVMPNSKIHTHDGEDICGWLRDAPQLVKSCPQLLSLRDLHTLLEDIVNGDTITRSSITIGLSEAAAKVFVPTKAYDLARSKLANHGFVVLEGPPEMGKTTIGRIIALAQMCGGWEALEVRGPAELLKVHRKSRSQVFVADDFFGRTEYDPTAVSSWQAELAHILPLLDSRHWLILTSRAHLLAMARSRLDISGQNDRFPTLGEVTVDASELTKGEKARMLYRHAKAAQLPSKSRNLVRNSARTIVDNRHFTPERIRRLISEQVPRLAEKTDLDSKHVQTELARSITDPTKQMRVSFRSLPSRHKWLLWSLLDTSFHRIPVTQESNLQKRFDVLCPPEFHESFSLVMAELTQGFLRKTPRTWAAMIDWVHPSCRDLAIEELAAVSRDRRRFLSLASIEGLLLAVSVGGGRGERDLPLLDDQNDWDIFVARAETLIHENAFNAEYLRSALETLEGRASVSPRISNAADILRGLFLAKLIPALTETVSLKGFQQPAGIEVLGKLRDKFGLPNSVVLDAAWQDCESALRAWTSNGQPPWEEDDAASQLCLFLSAVHERAPEEYNRALANGKIDELVNLAAIGAKREARRSIDFGEMDSDKCEEVLSRIDSLAGYLESIIKLPGISTSLKSSLLSSATDMRDILREFGSQESPDEEHSAGTSAAEISDDPDIEQLFSDL